MRIPDRVRSLCDAGLYVGCALSLMLLTACGGGGGGGGSGGGGGGGGSGASSYTIGGTISGLSASGLVLTDNGGDNLTVPSAQTTFTFATKLASGAAYAVAVATQPAGETCTVSSASGTVSSANVTSVTVSCTGNTYAISGSITGFNTSGLKLQDYSSGETLSVAAAATTFQFTQPVPYNTNVDVTVTTQPVWQTCAAGASNFSGPITANVTSDTFSCTTNQGVVTTVSNSSSFKGPSGVAMDSSGNIYIADINDNQILEIPAGGTLTVLAGDGTPGFADGSGGATGTAEFSSPSDVAVDSSGNVYVADSANNAIRKITTSGGVVAVRTLAGGPTAGVFRYPQGVAVDSSGNVFVADTENNQIRMVTPAGVVTILAGTGSSGITPGPATSASFNQPKGVAVDSAGNIYVADTGNNEIRKIDQSNVVSLLAGSTTGTAGHADGTGTAASLNGPSAVAVDSAGDVFVADTGNNEIRLVTPQGVVSTLAGSTTAGSGDGTGSGASFSSPEGISVDSSDNLFIGDFNNKAIRKVSP